MLKGNFEARVTFVEKLTISGSLPSMFNFALSLLVVSSLHLIQLNHFINHLISSYLISISNHIPQINYDDGASIKSHVTIEQTTIRIDQGQQGFPNHTTYAGPRPTYINLHPDPPKHEPVRATREYSTPPPYVIRDVSVGWVHATLAISHSQCTVVFSYNGIAEILSLPEYVASTTKS